MGKIIWYFLNDKQSSETIDQFLIYLCIDPLIEELW